MPTFPLRPGTIARNPAETIHDAIYYVRSHRHHPDCRCATFRAPDGAGYCGPAEHLWTKAVNKLLDQIMEG